MTVPTTGTRPAQPLYRHGARRQQGLRPRCLPGV